MPKTPDSKTDHLDPAPMTSGGHLGIAYPMVGDGGPKKTVEQWAAAKGMTPEFFPPPPPPKGSMPEAPRWNPKYGEYAAAKAGSRWPEGAEVTEAEFDAAVEKFYGPTNVMR